jgi:inner membrane protease ATP23
MTDKPAPPSSDGSPKGPGPLDRTYYTWSTMFRGILGLASKDEVRSYNAVWEHEKKDVLCRKCEDRKDYLMKYSPCLYPNATAR